MKKTDGIASHEEILSFFKNLQFCNFSGHDDFMFDVVPMFANILGYDEDFLFYDVNIGKTKIYFADVVIKQDVVDDPDIVVEVKFPGTVMEAYWKEQAKTLSDISGARAIVLISPVKIIIFSKKKFKTFSLASMNMKSLDEIESKLKTVSGETADKRHAAAAY